MLNWLFFTTFIMSFMFTLIGLLVDVTLQTQYIPQLESLQKKQQQSLKTYFELNKQFADSPLFNQSRETQLYPLKISKYISDAQTRLVDIATRYAVLTLGPHWMEKRHKLAENPNVEKFFKDITQYDCWPLTEKELTELDLSPSELIVAAQLHLAQAYYANTTPLPQALKNVRHLARLLIATSFMNWKRAGLSILEKEKDFIQFIRARKNTKGGDWDLVPQKILQNYIKLLAMTETYLSALNTPQTLKQVFFNKDLPIGFCAVFHKKKGAIQWEFAFLAPKAPFEWSFQESIDLIKDIERVALAKCPQLSALTSSVPLPWAHKIPYFRRLFALHATVGKGH